MTGRPALRWGLRLIGPALLVALLLTTDLDALVEALRGTRPAWFAAAVGVWVAIALAKAWRWRELLASQGIDLGYPLAARWYLAGLFLGGMSPGRLGELVKVAFIRDLGHPMGKALLSSVLDRLLDLLVLPVVAVAGMALYGAVFAQELGPVLVALAAAVVGAMLLWRGRRLLAIPVRVLMPPSIREQARVTVDDFLADLPQVSLRTWLVQGTLTAVCWVAYGAAAYLLAVSLGLTVDAVYLGVAVLAAALAGLLPITISGVGTRDAVLAAFFARLGLPTSAAIAVATLMLGLNVAVVLLYWPAYQASVRARPG